MGTPRGRGCCYSAEILSNPWKRKGGQTMTHLQVCHCGNRHYFSPNYGADGVNIKILGFPGMAKRFRLGCLEQRTRQMHAH